MIALTTVCVSGHCVIFCSVLTLSLQTHLGYPCHSCCSDKTVDHAKLCALFMFYQSVKALGWQPSRTVKPFKAHQKMNFWTAEQNSSYIQGSLLQEIEVFTWMVIYTCVCVSPLGFRKLNIRCIKHFLLDTQVCPLAKIKMENPRRFSKTATLVSHYPIFYKRLHSSQFP